ncbi:MAG TPA: radical SAM protein, partial [Syntrophales bacterium]
MNMNLLQKLARHQKRLEGMPLGRKIYYVANVLVGETYRKRGLGPLGPRLVEITVTNRCQCRCVHCYNETAPPVDDASELTRGEIARICKDAARIGFAEVNFTGGEPLLRKDIVALVKLARSAGMLPKMNTNGILLTDDMASRLKEAGLAWCAVSIDSSEPAVHDRLRGFDGCFK